MPSRTASPDQRAAQPSRATLPAKSEFRKLLVAARSGTRGAERAVALVVRPATVAWVLGLVVAALVLASVAGQLIKATTGHDSLGGLIPTFYVDEEANAPTWFSSALLLAAGGLLLLIAALERQRRTRFAAHWLFLGGVFVFLSLDETAGFHELLTHPLRSLLHAGGALHFAWILAAVPLLVLLGLGYWRFLAHLPARSRRLFMAAGAIYVGGAVGLEMVGGWIVEHLGGSGWPYLVETHVEELMEMSGLVLFIYALLDCLAYAAPALKLRRARD